MLSLLTILTVPEYINTSSGSNVILKVVDPPGAMLPAGEVVTWKAEVSDIKISEIVKLIFPELTMSKVFLANVSMPTTPKSVPSVTDGVVSPFGIPYPFPESW